MNYNYENLKHQGSNLGPSGTELGALPTELKLLLQRQVPTRTRTIAMAIPYLKIDQ